MSPTRGALQFPFAQSQEIDPYIAPYSDQENPAKPHVTLTFATSLDSNLSIAPGVQTLLSGPESKSMTHYLRSKHDAILVGVGTAIADDPSLNCRIEGVGGYGGEGLVGQPRPIVVDPNGRWRISAESKVIKLAKEGQGLAPWFISGDQPSPDRERAVEEVGGKVLSIETRSTATGATRLDWHDILSRLAGEGIKSIMVEGGGSVINDLLSPRYFSLVDSVIITIAPTWLGRNGVQVCPAERLEGGSRVPVGRLIKVKWVPLGEDVVLCGRPKA